MIRLRTATVAVILMILTIQPSHAIPAFARKYSFACAMCHTVWPRLNDFGQQFRLNGYQLTGQESKEIPVWQLPGVPISLRTAAGYTSDTFSPSGTEAATNQFEVNGLDILGGGLLGKNKGFYLAYLPPITASNGLEGQDAEFEQANAILSHLTKNTWLNGRVGRFEAAYVPISQVRSITISPYEIYTFNGSPGLSPPSTVGSLNTFALADPATGIELTGWNGSPWEYAFGFTNGSAENNTNDGPSDVYLHGAYIIGSGFGQTSGQRLGLMGYFGNARALNTGVRAPFTRWGFDASLNSGPYNAEIQFVQGNDNGAFNVFAPGTLYQFNGGFVQVNQFVSNSGLFFRYDWVNTPPEDNHDITRWTLGWRKYIDVPLMLQLEYSNRGVVNGAAPGVNLSENFITARLDWSF